MIELFVYGTLRSGAVSAHLMEDSELVETTCTLPEYTLISMGWYPGMAAGGDTCVVGEVYRVSDELLLRLTDYEGDRFDLREVRLACGRTVMSYLVHPTIAAGQPHIASGDFLDGQ